MHKVDGVRIYTMSEINKMNKKSLWKRFLNWINKGLNK